MARLGTDCSNLCSGGFIGADAGLSFLEAGIDVPGSIAGSDAPEIVYFVTGKSMQIKGVHTRLMKGQ